jgi:hypothetical protein
MHESELSYYQRQLHIMHRAGNTVLNIDCMHLRNYAPTRTFYLQLVSNLTLFAYLSILCFLLFAS